MRMHLSWVCNSWYQISDLGKHKDHDVKTIKKSAPVIKTELEKGLDKI